MTSQQFTTTAVRKPTLFPALVSKELLDRFTKLSQASGGFQIFVDTGYIPRIYEFDELRIQNHGSDWTESVIQPGLDPFLLTMSLWSAVPCLVLYPFFSQSWSNDCLPEAGDYENLGRQGITLANLVFDNSGSTLLPIAISNQVTSENVSGVTKQPVTSDVSIADIESMIIDTFSLGGLDELARLCGVTRQTLTNWRKPNAHPEKKNIVRLYALWDAARTWNTSGFPKPSASLRMPILQDQSLIFFLDFNNLDHDAIRFIGHRLLIKSLA